MRTPSRSVLLWAWIVATIPCFAQDVDTTKSESKIAFGRLHDDRQKIRSGECEFTITYVMSSLNRELQGITRSFHVWFDVDNNCYRIDYLDESGSKYRPLNFKFAKDPEGFRVIDLNEPNILVREFSPEFESKSREIASRRFEIDPRLMGLYPVPLESLRNYSISMILTDSDNDEVRKDVDHKTLPDNWILKLSFPRNTTWSYTFSVGSILPHSIRASVDTDFNQRVDYIMDAELSEVRDPAGRAFQFPKAIRLIENRDGKKIYEEHVKVSHVRLNCAIDKQIFTWKGLSPHQGVMKVRNNNTLSELSWWDGSQFVDKAPDIVTSAASPERSRRDKWFGLALVNVGIILALIVYGTKIWRRRGCDSAS